VPDLLPPFDETVLVRIQTHAEIFPDQEVCGMIGRDRETDAIDVLESDNLAPDPKAGFVIDRKYFDQLSEKYEILALYHSHFADDHPGYLSFEDIRQSKRSKLPYLLFHATDKTWDYFDPASLNPFPLQERSGTPQVVEFYLGWPWVWGRSDCWTVALYYYRGMLGLDLPDFDRAPTPGEQITGSWDRFTEAMPSIGFVPVDLDSPLQQHDLVLMTMEGEVAHHCGIITDIHKPEILHHLQPPRVSEKRVYGAYWRDVTVQRLRWKELM
jgi:proteasome lid subunit RPN8/RPN11